ncbi:oligoribonuclease, mitochondrial-like isoform X2 [Gigantopelta aegis]|nr:oligoribonuclease, mitochondrial-like isoform X2 [Gigantopelta aegis]
MTGLNKEVDHLMEIACLITDADLEVIAEGPNIVIHQPDKVLDAMGDWCKDHHGKSGLTQAVRNSNISLVDAESKVLKFVQEHTPKGACPLAGNSVHADREFLVKYMPQLIGHLHYRIIDVSTVKELCQRWYPRASEQAPKKKLSHRALDDIKESIAELKYYRHSIFKN